MSFLNCSRTSVPIMLGSTSIASFISGVKFGFLMASWRAIVVKNLRRSPRSASPLLKKNVAPRWPVQDNERLIVRDIVDFPVPAMPLSQNIAFALGSPTQVDMVFRSSTRVFARQVALCSSAWESKDAPSATGSRPRTIPRLISKAAVLMRVFSMCRVQGIYDRGLTVDFALPPSYSLLRTGSFSDPRQLLNLGYK